MHWTPVDLEPYDSCDIAENGQRHTEEPSEKEILLGALIQHSLLGGFNQLEFMGSVLFGGSVPSREVGGDFYDAYSPAKGSLDLILGDVMGKGVPAALLGASIRTRLYRSLFELYRDSPARGADSPPSVPEILSALDDSLRSELLEMHQFATLIFARTNMDSMRLDYSDCGHTAFCLIESDSGRIWNIKGANMPLGFLDSRQDYLEYSLPLQAGDLLLFYSDGLSEVTDEHGTAFGQQGIEHVLDQNPLRDPVRAGKDLLRTAVLHSGGSPSDDITIAVLKIGPPSPAHKEYVHEQVLHSREELLPFRLELQHSLTVHLDSRLESGVQEFCDGITIAAVEVLSNIFDHAGIPDGSDIFVKQRFDACSIWICVDYKAEAYDWVDVQKQSLSDLALNYSLRGYGTPLIRELLDSFSIMSSSGPISRIIMRKDIEI
ncbi:SpoIIE family protein phosphatase [Spirochaeta dissipatitropha]